MARAAIAAGADGLLMEVHHDPDHALSDGAQSLCPEQFEELMVQVQAIALAVGRTIAAARRGADALVRARPPGRALQFKMQHIVIVGTGLIGSSFGLALRKAGFTGTITGVSSPPAIADAIAAGAIDRGAPLTSAIPEADLVFLSQTIGRILDTIRHLDPLLRPGTLVTDAGSTKCAIVDLARQSLTHAQFLGGHPMAGKETRGAASADPNLFRGRTWILTPDEDGELHTSCALEFRTWLHRIGAHV